MSKINVLSSTIYNRIAAGEVVERPASVVKELVENAIDSGAKSITVEIADGGTSFIRVTDDGCGIEKSELKKALLPHATSKISKLSDLDNILSLGFRGEALASIASVSKITIESKPAAQENGASIHAEGGEAEDVADCGAADGTTITVNNLFYNTPAREKFLKTPRGEESEISTVMARFILGNLNVAFKYVADGKTIYSSYGDGLESAMVCIYGTGIIENCYYIDVEKNGLKISGYIGKSFYAKPNRTYQTFFLNGRYICNQTVASAIGNAYAAYLMKRQYPFYVLSVSVPPETVDVNVHPNKSDVRFSNNSIIYGTLYSVVSKVLDGSSEALNIITERPVKQIKTSKENSDEKPHDYATHNISGKELDDDLFSKKDYAKYDYKSVTFADSGAKSASFYSDDFVNKEKNNANDTNSIVRDIFAENKAYLETLEKRKNQAKNGNLFQPIAQAAQQEISVKKELKYIGQVLNTYLVLEDGADLYFADQHAAHERLLFDKFKGQIDRGAVDSQPLLAPYIIDCSDDEFAFLSAKKETLKEMGIIIEEFGSSAFRVSEIPVCFSDLNFGNLFDDILSDLNELKNISLQSLLKDKIAQKACKAAIKSGDKLRDQEVQVLLKALNENIGLKCPHGRPVVVKITRTEIDKWFKRIV